MTTTTTTKTRPAPRPLVVSETERSRIVYTRGSGYELAFDGIYAGTFDTMEQAEAERDRRLNAELERCPALSGTTPGEPQIAYALQYDCASHQYRPFVQIDGGGWTALDRGGWTYTEAEQIAEQYKQEYLQAWRRGEAVQG